MTMMMGRLLKVIRQEAAPDRGRSPLSTINLSKLSLYPASVWYMFKQACSVGRRTRSHRNMTLHARICCWAPAAVISRPPAGAHSSKPAARRSDD